MSVTIDRVDNSKMDLRETQLDGMDWTALAQDRDQCRVLVNLQVMSHILHLTTMVSIF
jgi:hypothetical protein